MLRSHKIFVTLFLLSSLWLSAYAAASRTLARSLVLWSPAAVLFLLGVYLLVRLILSVAGFPSRPGEASSLKEDARAALSTLHRRGLDMEGELSPTDRRAIGLDAGQPAPLLRAGGRDR